MDLKKPAKAPTPAPQQPMPAKPARQQRNPASEMDKTKRLSRIAAVAIGIAIIGIVFSIVTAVTVGGELREMEANSRNVVTATADIPAGAVITDGMLTVTEVPGKYVSTGAVESTEDIVGKVALTKIHANEQVTTSMALGLGNTAKLSSAIEEDMFAMSVSVDAASGLANLLHQGDVVDVVDELGAVIIRDAEVLALDAMLSHQEEVAYSTVTLQMTHEDAEKLAMAIYAGDVHLVLHAADANVTANVVSQ